MTSTQFNFRPPHIFKNMIVFPETTLKNINSADCNDSVTGLCIRGKTFQQCIDICNTKKDGDGELLTCSSGYYISDPNNKKKSICVTLREEEFGNPYYLIRNKSIYPLLDKYKSTVFINKNKWKFPPYEANIVFFKDFLTLTNVETQLGIKDFPLNDKNIDIIFNDINTKNNITIQIIQDNAFESRGKEFTPVKYGDLISLIIPNTNLIMEPVVNSIKWATMCITCISLKNKTDTFHIIPTQDSNKKTGDNVLYTDKFHLVQGPDIFGLENYTNTAKLFYMPISKAISKEIPVTFKFTPRMKGFYCEDKNKCSSISYAMLDKFDNEGVGTYKGKKIYRTPGCFSTCGDEILVEPRTNFLKSLDNNENYKDKENNKSYSVFSSIIGIIIILFSITIIIIFIYQLIKSKNNKTFTFLLLLYITSPTTSPLFTLSHKQ
jgi:hypothetical protein